MRKINKQFYWYSKMVGLPAGFTATAIFILGDHFDKFLLLFFNIIVKILNNLLSFPSYSPESSGDPSATVERPGH